MTVGGIALGIVVTIIILCIAGVCFYFLGYDVDCVAFEVGSVLGGIILIVVLWVGLYVYYNCTEEGARALKTQKSNFNGGIERVVTVYDMNGNVIEEFEGKFDVDYSDERILFDDENGNRHVIYFKTGTVIVNEKGE